MTRRRTEDPIPPTPMNLQASVETNDKLDSGEFRFKPDKTQADIQLNKRLKTITKLDLQREWKNLKSQP